ncbi:acyltransferase [Phragmitibacter flavus]|uniref:Acyltransferase n=1 Tax=Phragmitibacter flavus TaxID=2576071 RepID=A0A5R8KAB6_9BACT|nr:acyltransferase [Phragmitibacter flavus]TLD69263.1 acyltransferase [Phragmitibacter flavus]
MGSFRLILALIVVAAHTMPANQLTLINGNLAVKIFFTVSGFYMALILSDKYQINSRVNLSLFYSNRCYRIFPALWTALILELVLAWGMEHGASIQWDMWVERCKQLSTEGRIDLLAVYGFCQVSGIGVDLMHLFSYQGGNGLVPVSGPVTTVGDWRGWSAFPMSHAWSISCELMFYLAAPFLVRVTTWKLLCFVILPTVVATHFIRLGPLWSAAIDFWVPFQAGYFVLGIVSWRLFRWTARMGFSRDKKSLTIVIVALITWLGLYRYWSEVSYRGAEIALFALILIALPILFHHTKSVKWDRFLGEFSYPIYLVHISVIRLTQVDEFKTYLEAGFISSAAHWLTVCAISGAISLIYMLAIDRRIEHWRQERLLQWHGHWSTSS